MGIYTHLTEIYEITEKKEMLYVSSMQVSVIQWWKKYYTAKLKRDEHSTKKTGGMQPERYLLVLLKM